MSFKIVISTIFLFTTLFAGYEKVSIGSIDSYYENKISKFELEKMIGEIEFAFESSTGVNAFDYSVIGKPINLIYVPPSNLEKKIEKKQQRQKNIRNELENIKKNLPNQRKKVLLLKSEFEKKNQIHNENVRAFNNYVKSVNRQKGLTKSDIAKIKEEVQRDKKRLNEAIKNLRKEQRELKKVINSFNNETYKYNRKIREFNLVSKDIESMSRSLKKIRGRTFGLKEIQTKTIFKDGKVTKERRVSTKMDKIEIYGFNSKRELKAILAHEIGHLIGLPHINQKNALMNPILQKNQIENLSLTLDDIENFRDNF